MWGRYWTGMKLWVGCELGGVGNRLGTCCWVAEWWTYRLQKKYSRYIHIGIDGKKNCLVAGIKHTSNDTVGIPILNMIGMGAMNSEKSINPTRAGYCTSNHPHR